VFIDDLDSPAIGRAGVLLFSGGADSTLLAHALIQRGKAVTALSIDYPGRPAAETERADRIGRKIGFADRVTIGLNLPWRAQKGEPGTLNEGWFPHRNLMFLSIARHVAEIRKLSFVSAGYARTDGIVFTDATPDFIRSFDALASLSSGQKTADGEVDFVVPFFEKDAFFESEARRFPALPALLAGTWSCWRDGPEPCGVCAACREREAYFPAAELAART